MEDGSIWIVIAEWGQVVFQLLCMVAIVFGTSLCFYTCALKVVPLKEWIQSFNKDNKKKEKKVMKIERSSAKKEELVSTSTSNSRDQSATYEEIKAILSEAEEDNKGIPLYDHSAPLVTPLIRSLTSSTKSETSDSEQKTVESNVSPAILRATMLDLDAEEPPIPDLQQPLQPSTTDSAEDIEVTTFADFTGQIITDQKWIQTNPVKVSTTKVDYDSVYVSALIDLLREVEKLSHYDNNFPIRFIHVLNHIFPNFINEVREQLSKEDQSLLELWKIGKHVNIEKIAVESGLDMDKVIRVLLAMYRQEEKNSSK